MEVIENTGDTGITPCETPRDCPYNFLYTALFFTPAELARTVAVTVCLFASQRPLHPMARRCVPQVNCRFYAGLSMGAAG